MSNLIWLSVFVLVMLVIGPLCTIWGLNTLFPVLDIPYDFEHWAAVVILGGLFKTNVTKKG